MRCWFCNACLSELKSTRSQPVNHSVVCLVASCICNLMVVGFSLLGRLHVMTLDMLNCFCSTICPFRIWPFPFCSIYRFVIYHFTIYQVQSVPHTAMLTSTVSIRTNESFFLTLCSKIMSALRRRRRRRKRSLRPTLTRHLHRNPHLRKKQQIPICLPAAACRMIEMVLKRKWIRRRWKRPAKARNQTTRRKTAVLRYSLGIIR